MKILDPKVADVRTARLVLRTPRVDDADALFALFKNWNVVRFLSSPPWPYRREDADAYLRGAIEHPPGFYEDIRIVTLDGALIGVIGARMSPADAARRGPAPNLGYWLGEPFWGRGFMSEAASAFIGLLFDAIDAPVVHSAAFADNTASLRLQDKLGFVREGMSSVVSRPRGAAFPQVDTVLTRDRFGAGRGRPA